MTAKPLSRLRQYPPTLALMALLMPVLVNFFWLIRLLTRIAFDDASFASLTLTSYTYSTGIQIFYHRVYFVTYKGGYVLRAWRQTYEQHEQLKKTKLQHQLDTLKSQINPYFLFNSLNSLSSLISESPARADAFLDEISSVYRYCSGPTIKELTTLGREMDFINSYFQLLKTRYGAGIELRVRVDEWQLERKISPLTLQLLVENARNGGLC